MTEKRHGRDQQLTVFGYIKVFVYVAWTVNYWQEIKRFGLEFLSNFNEKISPTAYVYLSDVFKIPLEKLEVKATRQDNLTTALSMTSKMQCYKN